MVTNVTFALLVFAGVCAGCVVAAAVVDQAAAVVAAAVVDQAAAVLLAYAVVLGAAVVMSLPSSTYGRPLLSISP
jgi:hypothetical protein